MDNLPLTHSEIETIRQEWSKWVRSNSGPLNPATNDDLLSLAERINPKISELKGGDRLSLCVAVNKPKRQTGYDKIREQVAARDAAMKATQDEIADFLRYLASAKFTGEESDGSRKDWVSTGEVIDRLRQLQRALNID